MFGRILVPLDGSRMADGILPHLAAIPQLNGAPITLLRVLESTGAESTAVDPLSWHFAKVEAQAHLDEAAKQLAQLGLASNTVLLEGKAAVRIVEYAHKHNPDLLVLSSHGQGGLNGWNISAVALKVIQYAGVSIMLVRSSDENAHSGGNGERIQYHRILAPLDGSQRAECALPLAGALAERHSAELLLVYVVIRPQMIQRVPLSPQDVAIIESTVSRNSMEADKYFAQLQSRLPHPPIIPKTQTRVLVDDSVTRALHDLVEQEQADLVVLTAHGQSCYSRLPYSALVNSFITYGATSLLILQDIPADELRRAMVKHGTREVSMPSRSAYAEEGLNVCAQSER